MRRYRWGKFQGWVLLLFGLLGVLVRHSFFLLNLWGIFGAVVQTAAGFGLIQRARYGIICFYLGCALLTVGSYTFLTMLVFRGIPIESFSIVYCALAWSWWGIPAIFYYPKRWKEMTMQNPIARPNDQPENE